MNNTGFVTGGLDITFDYLTFLFGPSKQNADFHLTSQYANFDDMVLDYKRRGTIRVNTDFSDNTIFGEPRLNWYFRYWHDMAHLATGAPFTADGERIAATYQMTQVWALQGPSDADKRRWCAIIDVEVNGQVDYYLTHGEFVSDQRGFAALELAKRGYDVNSFPSTLDGLTIEY